MGRVASTGFGQAATRQLNAVLTAGSVSCGPAYQPMPST